MSPARPLAGLDGKAAALGRRLTRHRLLAGADQAASSLSNVVVFVLVARSFASSEPVGAFSLAMIVYVLVLGAVRALIGEPLLSLYSAVDASERRRQTPDLLGAALLLGLVASGLLWLAATWIGGLSGAALAALAAVLPVVVLQDVLRYLFIIDRPGTALAMDLVWLVAVVVAMLMAPGDAGVGWYVAVWGLSGALGGLVGLVASGRPASRPRPWRWLVDHQATGVRYLGDFGAAQAVGQFAMAGLGAIGGLGALGVVKASQVFFGPLNTVHASAYLIVVPEGARRRDEPARLRRLLVSASAGMVVLAVAWTVMGIALPDRWGRELLGGTWADAQDLMLPMGIATIAGAVGSGGLLGLRSLGDARRSLSARLQTTPWIAVCPLAGAAVAGAGGFAAGFAVSRVVAAAIWWRAFRQALHDVAGRPAELERPMAAASGELEAAI